MPKYEDAHVIDVILDFRGPYDGENLDDYLEAEDAQLIGVILDFRGPYNGESTSSGTTSCVLVR